MDYSTTDSIIQELYSTFGAEPEGEDRPLAYSYNDTHSYASLAGRQHAINVARTELDGDAAFDGVLFEAVCAANAETEPNLKIDALLNAAAVALAFAASVQRQLAAFDAAAEESAPKAKVK